MRYENDLHDRVTESLLEFSWRRGYPIHPVIGQQAVLEAFRGYGAGVETTQEGAKFSLNAFIGGNIEEVSSFLSFDEILSGWKWHAYGCPTCLHDAICMVFDRMGERYEDDREKRSEWFSFRRNHGKVAKIMEGILLQQFSFYQETMLIPISGEIPQLGKPKIFDAVLKEFPMQLMTNALIHEMFPSEGLSIGPCAEYIDEHDWTDFDQEYHPSSSNMVQYFLGKYFQALSIRQGYQGIEKDNTLRQFVVWGPDGFRDAMQLDWPEKIRNKRS